MNGFRVVDEPAKLLRRLAVFNLLSSSDDWRICRKISGGGGGNGSSRISGLFASGGGGGGKSGKSGLGTRSIGRHFFGGLSGTHSSSEIIGPITTGPSKSLDSD